MIGRNPSGRPLLFGAGIRHLGQRQILGESAGGEPFGPAGEERHQRAPGPVGARGAVREVDRYRSPTERLLEMRPVLHRRAEQHGHAVEPHAAPGLLQDPARDLDAFVGLARGRLEGHGVVVAHLLGSRLLEQVRLERGEAARPASGHEARLALERPLEEGPRASVAGRSGGEDPGRPPGQGGHQVSLGGRGQRNIEEQGGEPDRRARRSVLDGRARPLEHQRPVGEPAPL